MGAKNPSYWDLRSSVALIVKRQPVSPRIKLVVEKVPGISINNRLKKYVPQSFNWELRCILRKSYFRPMWSIISFNIQGNDNSLSSMMEVIVKPLWSSESLLDLYVSVSLIARWKAKRLEFAFKDGRWWAMSVEHYMPPISWARVGVVNQVVEFDQGYRYFTARSSWVIKPSLSPGSVHLV
jgi:hypothetical protein